MTTYTSLKTNYTPRGISSRHVIEQQIPQHIREDSPLLTKFLEYYYEFVEFDQQIVRLIQDIVTFNDIDEVDLDFLITFFEEYRILPNKIAVDERFIAKHIYELYKSKGTEKSVKLLFKIIWGDDVNLEYPSEQILRTSDGRWGQQNVILVESTNDILNCESFKYRNIIVDIDKIYASGFTYRIHFNSNHRFLLEQNQELEFYGQNGLHVTAIVKLIPNKVNIVSSGELWSVGQHVYLNQLDKPCICKITSVYPKGKIKTLEIIDFGETIGLPETIQIISSTNQTVTVNVVFDTLAKINGKWKSHHGILSNTETRLHDNFYYQLFSYVISSKITFKEFYPQQQKIHPIGFRCFGNFEPYINYNVSASISSNIEKHEHDVYLVDSTSPIDPVSISFILYVNRFDSVIASSLREIDNYDVNNQYKYYNTSIDWDEIQQESDPLQYTQEDEFIDVVINEG